MLYLQIPFWPIASYINDIALSVMNVFLYRLHMSALAAIDNGGINRKTPTINVIVTS